MDFEAMGRRIRIKRKQKGLTQEKLAELCDISMSFMGHIERGTRIPSIETLAKIAESLNCSMGCLMGYPHHGEANIKETILFQLSTIMDLVKKHL